MVVQQVRRVGQEERRNDLPLLLEAWREQVEQARRGQEAGWSLAQGLARDSTDAYEDFSSTPSPSTTERTQERLRKALGKDSESNNSRKILDKDGRESER